MARLIEKLAGKDVFIRTLTGHYLGHVAKVAEDGLVLDKCSWVVIPERRDGKFIREGVSERDEREYYGDGVYVASGPIVTCHVWPHGLPTTDSPAE